MPFYEDAAARLPAALRRVLDNAGCPGPDGISTDDIEDAPGPTLRQIKTAFAEREYAFGLHLGLRVKKQSGAERILHIPNVVDRIALTAAAMTLAPVFEAEFERSSFGYRKGRSRFDAFRYIEDLYESGYRWVVDADVDDFFDTVDHQTLADKLSFVIPEGDTRDFLRGAVNIRYILDGEEKELTTGLPTGSPISPMLANLYLDELDEELEQAGYKPVRFADDFIILTKSRKRAEDAFDLAEEVLDKLKLALNDDAEITTFDRGFRYLGAIFLKSIIHVPPRRLKDDDRIPVAEKTEATPAPARSTAPRFFTRSVYITTHGTHVNVSEGRLNIASEGESLDIPFDKLDAVVCAANAAFTTPALRRLLDNEIPVHFLSNIGKHMGRLAPTEAYDPELDIAQPMLVSDENERMDTARAIVAAKIYSQRELLHRYKARGNDKLLKQIKSLGATLKNVSEAAEVEALLGYEGSATKTYYAGIAEITRGVPFAFAGRSKRPPRDAANALLSFGYAVLFSNLFSLVEVSGLNPYLGFLHTPRKGHPALVSDLIEEFRAPIVDSEVITIINRGYLKPADFIINPDNPLPVMLGKKAKGVLISGIERRMYRKKQSARSEACLWDRMSRQVLLMRDYVRGDEKRYYPLYREERDE